MLKLHKIQGQRVTQTANKKAHIHMHTLTGFFSKSICVAFLCELYDYNIFIPMAELVL